MTCRQVKKLILRTRDFRHKTIVNYLAKGVWSIRNLHFQCTEISVKLYSRLGENVRVVNKARTLR